MQGELKYKDITEKIIGLSYAREIAQEIFYKELQEPIGTRRADFVVEGKVLSNHRT